MVPLKVKNLCPNTNRPLKNKKFMPKGPLKARNLHPNTNKPLKNEKFTRKGPLKARYLHPYTNRPLKNEKFMPKGPLGQAIYIKTQIGHSRMSNLGLNSLTISSGVAKLWMLPGEFPPFGCRTLVLESKRDCKKIKSI